MSAGYSGTPLVKKLGIKAGFRVALVGAPPGFREELVDLPKEVSFVTSIQEQLDFVLFFATTGSELTGNFSRLATSPNSRCA